MPVTDCITGGGAASRHTDENVGTGNLSGSLVDIDGLGHSGGATTRMCTGRMGMRELSRGMGKVRPGCRNSTHLLGELRQSAADTA